MQEPHRSFPTRAVHSLCDLEFREGLPQKQVEPHSPTLTSATPRSIPEQLRRTAPPLASPLVRWLDQPRGLERTAKARLMQPTPKQELVRLLELTECERRRKQAKSNRRLIESQADRLERSIEQCPLPRR